jgi:cytochrome c oxidase cbb3-type subunit III
MFNNYLQSIEGVGIYPIFSLLVFLGFFIVMLIWMFKANKEHLKKMSELPLDSEEKPLNEEKIFSGKEMNDNKFNRDNLSAKLILFLFVTLFGSSLTTVSAQTTQPEGISESYINLMLMLFFGITFIAFALLLYLGMGEERKMPRLPAFDFLKVIKDKLTGAVPVERENEILLEDDFDGIKELDNKIPPWFNLLFLITVVIAVIYMLNFYVFKTGKLQYQEYQEEMQEAAIQKAELIESGAFINENTVARLTDESSLSIGENIFKSNCVPCHGPEAGGVIGPNLTDDFWIHGGGIKNIFHTITYGVPAKGMISWQMQLNSKQIQEVASYVMSLHGTHPANPKPPQGDKYIEPQDSTSVKGM